jgi:hypothetical protein
MRGLDHGISMRTASFGVSLAEECGWCGFRLPGLLRRPVRAVAWTLTSRLWAGIWYSYFEYIGSRSGQRLVRISLSGGEVQRYRDDANRLDAVI